jgi:F-type H+-transporting ATPase subunit b
MADLSLIALLAAAGAEHAEPTALGLSPTAWVALAMLGLIGIALYAKVPGMLTSGLDSGIAEIRKQLEEARALRAEAEALRKEYAAKIANAEKEAAGMKAAAEAEAQHIVDKAKADATALIERRAKAADAAATAARGLIAKGHDAGADKKLVDEAIAAI